MPAFDPWLLNIIKSRLINFTFLANNQVHDKLLITVSAISSGRKQALLIARAGNDGKQVAVEVAVMAVAMSNAQGESGRS